MDTTDAKTPPAWIPKGITKSNSNASAGGRSTKSYDSVKVIGNYALGSLRVLRPEDSPRHSTDDGEDQGPPSLLPPSNAASSSRRDPMAHTMGGGDIVVILYLPKDYTVGYDSVAFTARNFVGVRNLPAGPHFFWASRSSSTSARCGFWIMSSGADRVHVVQWHRYNEVFVQPTRTEARIQAENIDNIFHQLPRFRDPSAVGDRPGELQPSRIQASAIMWNQLTYHISKAVLNRITSDQEDGWNFHTCDRVQGSLRVPAEMELDRRLSHPLFQSHELKFRFEQQARTFSLGSLGSDRTRDAVDATTYVLSCLAESDFVADEEILGDLQFAYIVGVYLGNDACVQQWWFMVLRIFLRAHRLIIRRPALVAAMLDTLTAQLYHSADWVDGSILDYSDALSRDLRISLIVYKRRMMEIIPAWLNSDSSTEAATAQAFQKLEVAVAHLGWDLGDNYLRTGKVMLEDGVEVEVALEELQAEDERGEFAPEIVELDEHGRQIGLMSWSD
ncbi:hypothetical protein XA68_16105 [Ophiocordyceps unilateralis]|uniref:AAR2 domain containing protein n=1 Tax=Ophiocordyceps unilateralis TaxID=268505 RepID=A0A2A9P5L3_OPHUN|nr:hypothetical protein XA68_16105 [Ophiocordyceps unilateralis]